MIACAYACVCVYTCMCAESYRPIGPQILLSSCINIVNIACADIVDMCKLMWECVSVCVTIQIFVVVWTPSAAVPNGEMMLQICIIYPLIETQERWWPYWMWKLFVFFPLRWAHVFDLVPSSSSCACSGTRSWFVSRRVQVNEPARCVSS